jgi:hypothetical protein
VGGIFMTVTGLEPTKTPGTVWANSWFDLGFAFVILGLVATGVGVVLHFRKEVQPTSAPPAVDSAEWIATCDESGGENNTLVFNLRHRFNPAEILNFGELRCTVTDPDQIETTATDRAQPYLYIDSYFPGAPPVRPGLYRFMWQGRNSKGAWVDIKSGEYLVKAPRLIVTILEDSQFENWKRIALIAALRVKITNTTGAMIRLSSFGFTYDPEGLSGLRTTLSRDEDGELDRELHNRRERQHYGIPLRHHATVPAGEFITGWVVEAVPRKAQGGTPSCTVVIKDELGNEYRATLPKREPELYGS